MVAPETRQLPAAEDGRVYTAASAHDSCQCSSP